MAVCTVHQIEFRIFAPAVGLGPGQGRRTWYSEKPGLDSVGGGAQLFYDTGTVQFGVIHLFDLTSWPFPASPAHGV